MNYKPAWNSLKEHVTPKWFKDAKFGIYTHWGIYSVPACRPNATWYPFEMYREGTEQYNYHVRTYGGPSKFGYKDFIPMFTGEKFDAEEWAELFSRAGAKFAGPVGEHHDGFTLWNTKLNEWNSVNMGPKKDVVGELEKSIRKKGMRYMVALHHAENWFFYPHWRKDFDTSDPRYASFYGESHNLEWEDAVHQGGFENFQLQEKPSKAFLDKWLYKIQEVVDNYRPDLLWFDHGLKFIQEHYKQEFLANYYNMALEWGNEVAVIYKWQDLAVGSGVIDLELGRFDDLTYNDWITDTTVDDGEGWGYLFDAGYKTPKSLIHYLIDNVSKNGYMLLNVGPKPNGEIPEEAKHILDEMGRWLSINGEAIYGTTPWMTYGEGPTKMIKTGPFCEDQELLYNNKDMRFTVKDDNLYAIILGWPEGEVTIESMKRLYPTEIASVRMLGAECVLPWKLTDEGLKVAIPATKPCEHAYVFKIERKCPF